MSQNPLSFRISGSSISGGIPKPVPESTINTEHRLVPSNPSIWGPITWYNIHTMAFSITEEYEIKVFIKMLRAICEKLPCSTCKEHAKKFLVNNPPEKEIGTIPSKCFKYTVDFHNHANMITGKSLMSFDEAFKLYSSKESKPYFPIKTVEDLGLTSIGKVDKTKTSKQIKEVRKLDSTYFDD